MMWVGVLVALGTVAWFVWAVKHERSERIDVRELQALVDLARCNTFVAAALAHREAIRDTRGDPDGTDPVITDVDRCVREVARTSQRLLRGRARRDRAATRQATLGAQADPAAAANLGALDEKLQQLDESLGVVESQIDRMLAHLARVRETEQAKLAARLRPRSPRITGEPSGLSRLADRAAQVVREVTKPRGQLASASGVPVPAALVHGTAEGTSAHRPAPRAARSTETVPDAAPVVPTRRPSRPRAPAAAALGRNKASGQNRPNKASQGAAGERSGRRLAMGQAVRRPTGRQPVARIEVRTSPAVQPLNDRAEAGDPERTLVQAAPRSR